MSCPHAHQQNGSAERKHQHIVEVGLALLANASMPLKFWDEAFLTATYIIILLPSKVINFDTPVQRLLKETPNYDSLRTFDCACWPNLRLYNTRKLSFRSTRCVFLGYSSLHKGFKCLEPSTGRVYISRNVVFDESVYPFESLHPNAGARIRNDVLLLPEDLLNPSNEGVGCTDSYATNDHNLLSESDVQNFSSDGLQQSLVEPQAPDVAPDPSAGSQEDLPRGSSSRSQADTPALSNDEGASPRSPRGGQT